MGSICGCTTVKNSEAYIKLIIETTCLQQVNNRNLETNLIYHMKRSNENYGKPKYEINPDLYQLIIKDIIEGKFIGKERKHFHNLSVKATIVKKFLEKIYELINFSINAHFFIFKLVMTPITLKDLDKDDEGKTKHLFQLLKSINLKDCDVDMSLDTIPFNQFCDSLLFYITTVISGYSKKLYETLTELEMEPMIRYDLLENLQEYFEMKLFNSYFKLIMGNFMKQLLLTRKEERLDDYNVTYDDFKSIIDDNPQLIHYFQLREDYLLFARKSKDNNNNNNNSNYQ